MPLNLGPYNSTTSPQQPDVRLRRGTRSQELSVSTIPSIVTIWLEMAAFAHWDPLTEQPAGACGLSNVFLSKNQTKYDVDFASSP
jgi:hypothetical protein